jgi:hypothetical protein
MGYSFNHCLARVRGGSLAGSLESATDFCAFAGRRAMMAAMNQTANQPAPQGRRLAPGPFVVTAAAVYLLSFASQVLLSPWVTRPLSVLPFALVQGVLIWLWYVVHVRRLNDAGRPTGTAAGIAIVYAIEVVLLVILVWLILESSSALGQGPQREPNILHLFVFLYLLTLFANDPNLELAIWIGGFLVLTLLPVLIAIGFSIWTGTRPRAPSQAPPSP